MGCGASAKHHGSDNSSDQNRVHSSQTPTETGSVASKQNVEIKKEGAAEVDVLATKGESEAVESSGTAQMSKTIVEEVPMKSSSPTVFMFEHQRWWAVGGWMYTRPGATFDDPPAWTKFESMSEASEAPPIDGPESWFVVIDDGTDDQGWTYAQNSFTDIETARIGGRGRARFTDCVARRMWVVPEGCSQLTGRARASHPEQLHALKAAKEEELQTAIKDTTGIVSKMLSDRPVGALLATSPVAWIRLRSFHEDECEAFKLRLMPTLEDCDKVRLKGCLYALPYAKAVYGYPMLQGHMDSVGAMSKAALQRLRTPGFDPLNSPDAQTNIAALLTLSGRTEDDLLHVHFDATPMRPAHAVLVDTSSATIIIAIRGTLSAEDAMTDAMANEAADEKLGHQGGGFHIGILSAAKWVAEQARPALDKAYLQFPGYRLLITGHSLGAGTAAILTLLLDAQRPIGTDAPSAPVHDAVASEITGLPPLGFNRIEGYLFACPGVVSQNVAESPRALECITSIACRMDVIVRTCLRSIDVLVHELASKSVIGTVKNALCSTSNTEAETVWPQHRTVGNCYWIPNPSQAGIYPAAASDFDRIFFHESMFADHLLSRYEQGLNLACQSHGLHPELA